MAAWKSAPAYRAPISSSGSTAKSAPSRRCVDSLLQKCGVNPRDVDMVFLTGGSSFVPAVRRIFETRFGGRVRSGNEFTSVARGLALKAAESAQPARSGVSDNQITLMKMQISAIVGARPNFVKMAPILEEARRRPEFACRLVHTGQHYSPEMSKTFFDELGMPAPDVNLEIGSGSHTAQTAGVMLRLEAKWSERRPDLALVVGDVNSTVAAALVASKLGIRVAHVEAGLRSSIARMPEETNRLVTDVLSDFLFASEPSGVANLLAEGIPKKRSSSWATS